MKRDIDDYLMIQFNDGDREAFTQLVERHTQQVFLYILQKIKNHEIASDLTQDVFVKVFKSANNYIANNKFRQWIIRIAQNICIDFYRKNKNTSIISINDSQLSVNKYSALTLLEILEVKNSNPAEEIETKELNILIEKVLHSMPQKQRTAFVLSQYQGMSYKEIAKIQNCPEGTIKSRIHTALIKIKTCLKEYDLI